MTEVEKTITELSSETGGQSETLTGGKWAANDDPPNEQVEAARLAEEYITVNEKTPYHDPDPARENVATIRGFWAEEEPENSPELTFVVLLDLGDESVQLHFPLFENNDYHNGQLEAFLKTCGVTTNDLTQLVGKHVYYEDDRSSAGKFDKGLKFYNSLTLPRIAKLQLAGFVALFASLIPMILWTEQELTILGFLAASVLLLIPLLATGLNRFSHFALSNYKINKQEKRG